MERNAYLEEWENAYHNVVNIESNVKDKSRSNKMERKRNGIKGMWVNLSYNIYKKKMTSFVSLKSKERNCNIFLQNSERK